MYRRAYEHLYYTIDNTVYPTDIGLETTTGYV